jgi:TonB family protein
MNIHSTIALIIFNLIAVAAQAQKSDTTYFDANWKPSGKLESFFYRVTKTIEVGKKYNVTEYQKNGKLFMTGSYSTLSPEVKDGVFTWYKDNGDKWSETVFENGKVKSKTNFEPDPNHKNSETEFVALEKQPQYPGGFKKLYRYLGDNFHYPKGLKPRPKGTIVVNFVIDKDGSITEVYVKQGVHPLLDAEAIRMVENMAKWEPGVQHGKAVKVAYNIPIDVE